MHAYHSVFLQHAFQMTVAVDLSSRYLNALHTCFPGHSSSIKHIIDILISNSQTGLFSRLLLTWNIETFSQAISPGILLKQPWHVDIIFLDRPLVVFPFSFFSTLRFTFEIGPRFTSEEIFKPRWQPAIKLRLQFRVEWESGRLSLANYSVWWQQRE